MKRLSTLILLTATITSFSQNQDIKKEAESIKTKMDIFSSKTGSITKFIDSKLPNLKTSFGGAETRIRQIINGTNSMFFYQIVKEGKYSKSTASIEYSDLVEVILAVTTLKAEIEKDIALKPDYLENKFITVDGFQVGYYVSDGKTSWYIKLEKYGSENTIFIDDVSTIETGFNEAKAKIDELRK